MTLGDHFRRSWKWEGKDEMFKWNKENFSLWFPVLTVKYIFRLFLKKFVNIINKTLIFSQGQRSNWCISKDLEIELKESSFFKYGMQNQLISEDWRFWYVFLLRLLQAIWIHLWHRSQQIALCLFATAFWHMPHGNIKSHLPKNCVICFSESPLKMMKNAFYFILKTHFILKIFRFLSGLFGHVGKMVWLGR